MKNTNETNQPPIKSPYGHFAEILEELEFIAKEKDSSVLFIGETGVGKEVLADYLVEHSDRKNPYGKINCVGLSETTIGSELFGHVKGAFTDAHRDKKGFLEVCDNGILLLDELGAMNKYLQAKLLRVIETKEFQKVGSEKTQNVNIRFIAATNRDEKIVAKYKDAIIEDLKARFKYPIHIKPLRERPEDIPHFLKHFLKLKKPPFESIEVETLCCLMVYDWPENVRQLKNILDRAEIKRQVWESKNPNDPSNGILCGFHLPDEVVGKYRSAFGKFREFTDFQEVMQKRFHAEVFHSNVAASYWSKDMDTPEYVYDNKCLYVPIDDKFYSRAYEIGLHFAFLMDHGAEELLDRRIAGETIPENEIDRGLSEALYFRRNPIYLFDLQLEEAKAEFPLVYYLENRRRYPDLNQTQLADKLGTSRQTIGKYEKLAEEQMKRQDDVK